MSELLISILFAFLFGLGVPLSMFGTILTYKVFFEGSSFNNAFVPMSVAFILLSLGLTFLYIIIF